MPSDREAKKSHKHKRHKHDRSKQKHVAGYEHQEVDRRSKHGDSSREKTRKHSYTEDAVKNNEIQAEDEGPFVTTTRDNVTDRSEMLGDDRENPYPETKRSFREQAFQDANFDFSQHKDSLNKLFFRAEYFIQRSIPEYNDFWSFLERYQAFQRKKSIRDGDRADRRPDEEGFLGLPKSYDKRYRINVAYVSKDVDYFMKKGRLIDADIDKELTRDRVALFKNILVHFLDFRQKQKFSKLKKISTDQRNLPIFQHKQRIIDAVRGNQVVIVAGDTGCGKSTQVPQYLLEAQFKDIACTQPRRIACMSLTKRVGYETLNEFGTQVAYQVRFDKSRTKATRILFLTEGLLLRQITTDEHLSQYNVIVVDEVHERHVTTDILLGVLKCLLQHRSDLKLILMSATINIELFSSYFSEAPVVKVPGRLYPIQMEYCPISKLDLGGKSRGIDPSPYLKIMQRIDNKYPLTERGDLLIFLSGVTDISTIVDAAKMYAQKTKRWIILPLYSNLSIAEQEKIFDIAPEGVRKCIVATNIAETSVTIDGVRFIVDSGKVKEMSFDPKYKMQRLQEFWISRASAEQRKGRAGSRPPTYLRDLQKVVVPKKKVGGPPIGEVYQYANKYGRTGPGMCYRLYDESDYNEFDDYATPAVHRVPLDSIVLQLIAMGLPDVRKFPFIEAPSDSSLENSIAFLKEQDALTPDEQITPIGKMLSRLPVDVIVGKMLVMGSIFHMIDPVLSIAAAMSVQSPYTNRSRYDHDATAARKSIESDHGDPFTLLNAFDEWIQVKAQGQGTNKWCKKRGFEEQRFYEMTKLKKNFQDLLQDHGLLVKDSDNRQKFFSSDERRRRHGDRKRLGELKRVQQKERKKRKVLKMDDEDFIVSDGEEKDDDGSDIKDLEFRLSHDLNQLQKTSNRSRSFTLRDISLLKVILCCGLYPQVAIADECNVSKGNSEQTFHTKSKPFVLLHPMSVFAEQPELLQPPDTHTNPADQLDGNRTVYSNKHELLCFVSLLETTKPYLMNSMRVPALQTLTLFAHSLDTNADCSRIVCDGWLEIKFAHDSGGEDIVSSVIQLRSTWQNLIKLRLEDTFQHTNQQEEISNPRARRLEKLLAQKLSEFLDSDVVYSVRRILPAEQQYLYLGSVDDNTEKQSVGSSASKPHSSKGGRQVNQYLTHNCLMDEASASIYGQHTAHMQRHWTCPVCDTSMLVTVMGRLQHEAECQAAKTDITPQELAEEEDQETLEALNPMRKPYTCPACDKDFQFTSTEILKHKKSHAKT